MRTDRGFTLLEVLVAFAIAAGALVVLFRGTLEGLRATRIASHYEEAISRARSRLAAVGRGAVVVTSDQQGDDGGGYHWHVRIAPQATAPIGHGDPTLPGPRVALYAVLVTVSWAMDGGDREVRLEGARVAIAPPAPP